MKELRVFGGDVATFFTTTGRYVEKDVKVLRPPFTGSLSKEQDKGSIPPETELKKTSKNSELQDVHHYAKHFRQF
eukprot:4187456-Amphidinium_carterae.1